MPESINKTQSDLWLVADVCNARGWAVIVFDQLLTRQIRYHAVRFPGEAKWLWFDEVRSILAACRDRGYDRAVALASGTGDLVATWELRIDSLRDEISS